MNPSFNHIPEGVQKIHITAVCGTGMGALACMLKEMGMEVTGSDQKVYPPMSTFLAENGIPVADGFKAENIARDTDLVIIGNAVRKDNPEVAATAARNICFCSMPQALNHFAAQGKKTLLITGTHGKTTTASLLAWVLFHGGFDPSFMIGGILQNFNSNFRVGKGDYMVVEGDEYDTAFFDKGPKFMHYQPYIAALTSIEFDHADIFDDVDHVKQVFSTFLTGMPPASTLVAFDNDPHIDQIISQGTCQIQRYGRCPQSFWKLENIRFHPSGTSFRIFKQNNLLGEFDTPLLGTHNALDTLAVIAMADHLNIPVETISEALLSFKGIKRRQEVRGQKRHITVMDDFAHHPTAVRETICAVKPACQTGRLIAVFEPRTNSSMRDVFQSEYGRSFDAADMMCVRHPPLLEKIPEGQRFSSQQLVADLKQRGKDAYFFPDTDAIIDFLVRKASPGDLILVMSNGGFDNIHERLLKRL